MIVNSWFSFLCIFLQFCVIVFINPSVLLFVMDIVQNEDSFKQSKRWTGRKEIVVSLCVFSICRSQNSVG